MKKDLTNAQIVTLYMGVTSLLQVEDLNMTSKNKLRMIRNKNTLTPLYDAFEEVRNQLIISNGEQNDEGTYSIKTDEQMKKYVDELAPILDDVVSDVTLFEISIDDIDDKVNVKTLEQLMEIIDDGSDPETSSDAAE